MITGFENIYAKIPTIKYYKYHGMLFPCNDQPEPKTFQNYPLGPGAEWVLIYDVWPPYINLYIMYYQTRDFLPSSDIDICMNKFPDNKIRYYFMEITYYTYQSDGLYDMVIQKGSICGEYKERGYNFEVYKTINDQLWAFDTRMLYLLWCKPPTHIRVWASNTGEKPGYNPV
jgi:hypothetical protein